MRVKTFFLLCIASAGALALLAAAAVVGITWSKYRAEIVASDGVRALDAVLKFVERLPAERALYSVALTAEDAASAGDREANALDARAQSLTRQIAAFLGEVRAA